MKLENFQKISKKYLPLQESVGQVSQGSGTRMEEKQLDCQGLQCPEPIIKLSKFVKKELKSGERLRMTATDPACRADAEAWCEQTGNRMVDVEEKDGMTILIIEKSSE